MRRVIFLSSFLWAITPAVYSSTKWTLSSDKKDRPITECIQLDHNGFYGAAIAMNCQMSVDPDKFLCSKGRMLHSFDSKIECEKSRTALIKLWGKYSLKSDPYEKQKD